MGPETTTTTTNHHNNNNNAMHLQSLPTMSTSLTSERVCLLLLLLLLLLLISRPGVNFVVHWAFGSESMIYLSVAGCFPNYMFCRWQH